MSFCPSKLGFFCRYRGPTPAVAQAGHRKQCELSNSQSQIEQLENHVILMSISLNIIELRSWKGVFHRFPSLGNCYNAPKDPRSDKLGSDFHDFIHRVVGSYRLTPAGRAMVSAFWDDPLPLHNLHNLHDSDFGEVWIDFSSNAFCMLRLLHDNLPGSLQISTYIHHDLGLKNLA